MALQPIGGGGGYDYVQDSEPSDPDTGETWLDQSESDARNRSKIYADIGNGNEWVVVPSLEQSDILSDETPFEGARIDASISDAVSVDQNVQSDKPSSPQEGDVWYRIQNNPIEMWSYSASNKPYSHYQQFKDSIIVGIYNDSFLRISSYTGEEIWSYDVSGYTGGGMAYDNGYLYVGWGYSTGGCAKLRFYDGGEEWEINGNDDSTLGSNEYVYSENVYVDSGTVIYRTEEKLLGLNTEDGTEDWTYSLSDVNAFGMVQESPGNYYAGDDGEILQFDNNGDVSTFTEDIEGPCGSGIDVDSDGNIYTADENDNVYKVDSSGSEVWKNNSALDSNIINDGAVAYENGYVIVKTSSDIYCFDSSDGSELWSDSATNGSYSGTYLPVDDYVFYHKDSPERFMKVDMSSGETVWTIPAAEWDSKPLYVNGSLYASDDSDIIRFADNAIVETQRYTGDVWAVDP